MEVVGFFGVRQCIGRGGETIRYCVRSIVPSGNVPPPYECMIRPSRRKIQAPLQGGDSGCHRVNERASRAQLKVSDLRMKELFSQSSFRFGKNSPLGRDLMCRHHGGGRKTVLQNPIRFSGEMARALQHSEGNQIVDEGLFPAASSGPRPKT